MPKPTEKPIVDMRSLSLRAGKALGRNGGHEGRSHMTFALRGRGGWLTGKTIALISVATKVWQTKPLAKPFGLTSGQTSGSPKTPTSGSDQTFG